MKIREEFPELQHKIYMNCAAVSLIPRKAKEAVIQSLGEREMTGEMRTEIRDGRELEARKQIARIINASFEEICLVSNTSEGLNIIAQGLPLKPGENVVFTDKEYPGNMIPWINLEKKGIEARIVKINYGEDPTEALLSAVDEKTRLLSLSFVGWIDGFRFDIEKIGQFCQERNIIFVVDAVQGAGAMQLDVQSAKISFISCGGFKWLLSPNGTGFIYVNKDLLPQIEMVYLSYMSFEGTPMEYELGCPLRKDASKFRLGCISDIGIAAMNKSFELLLETGIDNIERHVLQLVDYATERIKDKGYSILSNFAPQNRSGILTFGGNDIQTKYDNLIRNNIIVSFRKNWIRISPHLYNNKEDIDQMLDLL